MGTEKGSWRAIEMEMNNSKSDLWRGHEPSKLDYLLLLTPIE